MHRRDFSFFLCFMDCYNFRNASFRNAFVSENITKFFLKVISFKVTLKKLFFAYKSQAFPVHWRTLSYITFF